MWLPSVLVPQALQVLVAELSIDVIMCVFSPLICWKMNYDSDII